MDNHKEPRVTEQAMQSGKIEAANAKCDGCLGECGTCALDELREEKKDLARPAASEAPSGYKLVPLEPTPFMVGAGARAQLNADAGNQANSLTMAKVAYAAMLDAAPVPDIRQAAPEAPTAWIAYYDGVKSQNVARTLEEKAEIESIGRLMNSKAAITWEELYSRAPATQQAGAPVAWIATDLDGRAGVGFTKDGAKRQAGEGCTEFIPLFDLGTPAATTASASDVCKNEKCEGGYVYNTDHTQRIPCSDCVLPGKCGGCDGTGVHNSDPEDHAQEETCHHCEGTGRAQAPSQEAAPLDLLETERTGDFTLRLVFNHKEACDKFAAALAQQGAAQASHAGAVDDRPLYSTRQDAARYRWLTESPGFIRPHLNGQAVYVNWSGSKQALDTAIDAAIAANTSLEKKNAN